MNRILEATRMLEAFTGAGAQAFDVSVTTIEKKSVDYWPVQSPQQVREGLPGLIDRCLRDVTNLIIRPGLRDGLLQLDDLSGEMLERVRPLAFLVIATGPGSWQAWVSTEGCDGAFRRRVKLAVGADPGANGWVRVAGTLNVKPKYGPDFPTVRIQSTLSRPKVGPGDLSALGLVAPAAAGRGGRAVYPLVNGKRPSRFPSYQISLNGAPVDATGKKSHSHADYTWCCTAFKWGWAEDEVKVQLLKEPLSKAFRISKEKHPDAPGRAEAYAILTARKAHEAVFGK